MPALEVVEFHATAPTAVLGTVPPTVNPPGPNTGQGSIRSFDDTAYQCHLLTAWEYNQVAPGEIRIKSPRMHDNVQGIRLRSAANIALPLLPMGYGDDQVMKSQDSIIYDIAGSGVAGNIEHGFALYYYESLEGINARFIDPMGLKQRADQQVGYPFSVTTGVGGGFTGQVALNSAGAVADTLQANREYALLGMVANVLCGAIGITGADTGNLRVAIPGSIANPWITCHWFILLSQMSGVPMIPVFNMANKGGILIDAAQTQAGGAVTFSLIFQLLKKPGDY